MTQPEDPKATQPGDDLGGYKLLRTRIREGDDADRRLAELGLTGGDLAEIVRRGEYARATATALDPITTDGSLAYIHRVRAKREILGPRGWEIDRSFGLEATRSPCGRWSIITRAGDHGVGVRDAHPQPKRPPGDRTTRAINGNGTGLLDPDWMNRQRAENEEADENGDEDVPINTWMLLVYPDVSDRIRFELSLPMARTGQRERYSWLERILLPALELGDPVDSKREPEEPEEIDVPVTRKR